jgi:hypothetical protein
VKVSRRFGGAYRLRFQACGTTRSRNQHDADSRSLMTSSNFITTLFSGSRAVRNLRPDRQTDVFCSASRWRHRRYIGLGHGACHVVTLAAGANFWEGERLSTHTGPGTVCNFRVITVFIPRGRGSAVGSFRVHISIAPIFHPRDAFSAKHSQESASSAPLNTQRGDVSCTDVTR